MAESLVQRSFLHPVDVETRAPGHLGFDCLRKGCGTQRGLNRVSLHLLDAQQPTRKHHGRHRLRRRRGQSIVIWFQIDCRDWEADRAVAQPSNHATPLFRTLMFKRARKAVERAFYTVRPADNAPLDKQRRCPPGRYDRHKGSESAQRIRAGVETCDVAFCGCVGFEFDEFGRPSGDTHRETRSLPARLHEHHHKWQCAGCFKNVCGN